MTFDAKAKKLVYTREGHVKADVKEIEQALLEAYRTGQKAAYEDAAKEVASMRGMHIPVFLIEKFKSKAKFLGEK